MIPDRVKARFWELYNAIKAKDCVVLETTDREGKSAYIICRMVEEQGGSYRMHPLARMYEEDIMEVVNTPDGAEIVAPEGMAQA